MWPVSGRWFGRLEDGADGPEADGEPVVDGESREECLSELRRLAGRGAVLTVEVLPELAGVAEAAAIMGWDKRRVVTYLDRNRFPEPLAALASGRVWRRQDVEAFAEEWRARQRARRRP